MCFFGLLRISELYMCRLFFMGFRNETKKLSNQRLKSDSLKKMTSKDKNLDLSSVKFVMPMGSTVPESLCEDLQKFMTGMQFVYHIYGMTEIGSTIAVTIDVRNLGVVHANAAVKIVDPNTGKLCGPHETGEILAKGTCYMKGRAPFTIRVSNLAFKVKKYHFNLSEKWTKNKQYFTQVCSVVFFYFQLV